MLDEGILKGIFCATALASSLLHGAGSLEIYAAIKGYSVLFGWLLLLVQLQTFAPVYHLTIQLTNIIIKDMFPWILLYMTLSLGFASAIQLQFQLLPNATSCVEEESDLSGIIVNDCGFVLYELTLMTCGLDTDLKHLQHLGCLFHTNEKETFNIKFLVTMYAVISVVLLLNMFIAVMTNTLNTTLQEQGKLWRLYQVNTHLFMCLATKLLLHRILLQP